MKEKWSEGRLYIEGPLLLKADKEHDMKRFVTVFAIALTLVGCETTSPEFELILSNASDQPVSDVEVLLYI